MLFEIFLFSDSRIRKLNRPMETACDFSGSYHPDPVSGHELTANLDCHDTSGGDGQFGMQVDWIQAPRGHHHHHHHGHHDDHNGSKLDIGGTYSNGPYSAQGNVEIGGGHAPSASVEGSYNNGNWHGNGKYEIGGGQPGHGSIGGGYGGDHWGIGGSVSFGGGHATPSIGVHGNW